MPSVRDVRFFVPGTVFLAVVGLWLWIADVRFPTQVPESKNGTTTQQSTKTASVERRETPIPSWLLLASLAYAVGCLSSIPVVLVAHCNVRCYKGCINPESFFRKDHRLKKVKEKLYLLFPCPAGAPEDNLWHRWNAFFHQHSKITDKMTAFITRRLTTFYLFWNSIVCYWAAVLFIILLFILPLGLPSGIAAIIKCWKGSLVTVIVGVLLTFGGWRAAKQAYEQAYDVSYIWLMQA